MTAMHNCLCVTTAPVRHFLTAKLAGLLIPENGVIIIGLRAAYQVRACCWLPCGVQRPFQEGGAMLGLVQGCRGGVSMQLLHVGLSSLLGAAVHMESYCPPVPAINPLAAKRLPSSET